MRNNGLALFSTLESNDMGLKDLGTSNARLLKLIVLISVMNEEGCLRNIKHFQTSTFRKCTTMKNNFK